MCMPDFSFFTSGKNQLSYVCTKGEKSVGILFVHADQGNRLGPHRMFVELAQAFGSQGYSTFRFDLRGCGDSSGRDSKGQMEQDQEDTLNAIRFFQNHCELSGVIVLGISRGARVAFNLMAHGELPLSGLMLLSTPCSSKKAALKNICGSINHYFKKLRKPHYLLKLLCGKSNVRGIIKTLTHAWQLKNRYATKPKLNANRTCPVLLIYGQSDPICTEALTFYRTLCRRHQIKVQDHVIPGANHSFFHYRWKEQILDICENWLNQTPASIG